MSAADKPWTRSLPAGWQQLAADLDRDLVEIAGGEDYGVYEQVKQKHGIMRTYLAPNPALDADTRRLMTERIFETESMSAKTCTRCGERGQRHVDHSGRVRTLCDACLAPRGGKRARGVP